MLHMDSLDRAKIRAICRISRREDFGVNEVDVQPDGTLFLNGYFSAKDLQLLAKISEEASASSTPHTH